MEIVELINTMTMGEKRYFSLLTNHYERGKSSQLLQLYQALVANPTEESVFLKKHGNKVFARNFAAGKHQLGQRLLDALVHYHDDKVAVLRFRKQLSEAELLLSRNLFRDAEKRVLKVIDSCREACLFELELEGLRVLTSIRVQLGIWHLTPIYDRREQVLQCIREVDQYNYLLQELLQAATAAELLTDGAERLNAILKNPLLQPDYVHLSALGRVEASSFFSQYALITGDAALRRRQGEHILDALLGSSLLAEVFLPGLLVAAVNTLQDVYEAGDQDALRAILASITSALPAANRMSGHYSVLAESVVLMGQFYVHLLSASFAEITAQEKVAVRIIGQLAELGQSRSFLLAYLLSLAFYAEGNYKKAIRLIAAADPYKQRMRYQQRVEKQRYFLLLCHLRLRHYDMLERIVATHVQEVNEGRFISQAEQLLLHFFREVATERDLRYRQKVKWLLAGWDELKTPADQAFIQSVYMLRVGLLAELRGTDYAREWKKLRPPPENSMI